MLRWQSALIAIGLSIMSAAAVAETRQYDLEPFTEVDISSGVDAEITTGAQGVSIEATPSTFQHLYVNVRNGKLEIGLQRGILETLGEWLQSGRPGVKARITLPVLTSLSASAGASVDAEAMKGGKVGLSVSSGANASVGRVEGTEIAVSVSSGGHADVVGTCERLSVSVSSGGNAALERLECSAAKVDTSSGGSAHVFARSSIEANASSGGSATVEGHPTNVTINSTFGGNVSVSR
jgi:hypothetical protein